MLYRRADGIRGVIKVAISLPLSRKAICRFVIVVIVATFSHVIHAEQYSTDGITWKYTVENNVAIVGKAYADCAIGASGAVTVPAKMGGYPVKRVGFYAFRKCTSVTSITFSDGIEEVLLSGGDQYPALSYVNLPASVNVCGFSESCKVGSFVVDKDNSVYSAVDGVLYDKDVRKLIRMSYSSTEIHLPPTLEEIGSYSCSQCGNLASISICPGVTNICEGAFYCCEALESIACPDTLTQIGRMAFEGCTGLNTILLPNSMKTIGYSAFRRSGLTSIALPDGLASIGACAFELCKSLTDVSIPGSVKTIGEDAFYGCEALGEGLVVRDGWAICFNGDAPAEVVFPSGTQHIVGRILDARSSWDSTKHALTSIVIPEGVVSIGYLAFGGCKNLTAVTIPDSMQSIESGAFSACDGLGAGMIIVNGWLLDFKGVCPSDVTIPADVRGIAGSAFFGRSTLKSVILSDRVVWIGPKAFGNCANLASISIPTSVQKICENAFGGCTALGAGVVASGAWMVRTGDLVDEGVVYASDAVAIAEGVVGISDGAYKNYTNIVDVSFPTSLRYVGDNAFENCKSMTSIDLPDDISCVGRETFKGCYGVKELTIPATTNINACAFSGVSSLLKLKIKYSPCGDNSVAVYVNDDIVACSATEGAFDWQPIRKGIYRVLRIVGGGDGRKRFAHRVDVNELQVYEENDPSPPEPYDETISLLSDSKVFSNAKKSATTFSVTSMTGTGTWSASVSDDWISLTKDTGTVGVDKVAYVVEANTNAQARTGYVYVSGHVHTVVQPGTGATISMENLSVGHPGVEQSISVDTTVDGAPWYARPENQWISVRPTSGCGDGTVTVQVAPYYVVGMREGSATIAGKTVTIVQRGRDMQLGNETTNVSATAQSVLVDVKALEDVTWSVVSGADWVTVAHAGTGLGNSTIDLLVAANTSYLPRTATVSVGTETFTITQAGTTSLVFDISATAVDVPATKTAAKTLKITATTDLPWTVTSAQDWIQPLERYKSGSGTATIAYSVAANPGLASRTGVLTVTPEPASGVAAKTLTVTQAAAVSSVDKTSVSVTAGATTANLLVSVDDVVAWSVASWANWVTFEGSGSRTGSGTVVLHIAENTSLVPREGTVTIAGHVVTVQQAGGTVGISKTTSDVATAGGTVYVDVTGSANLNWTIQNVATWVTIEGDLTRKGPASLVIRIAVNTGTEDRSCEILLGGQKLTITQKAAGTAVNEDVLSYGSDVEFGSFDVTAPDYLTWMTTTTNDWIILTSGESTTGNGTVEYIVDETNSSSSRIGIIWVGNTPVYICQSGFTSTLGESSKEVSRVSGNGQVSGAVEDDMDEWCAVSMVPWITITTPSGIGSGIVQYSYEDNTTGVERVGRILVCEQVYTLTQTDADPSVPRWQISYENLYDAVHTNPNHYDEGDALTFVAPSSGRVGYSFAGWIPAGITSDTTGDVTIRAQWTANPYEVAFNANGGSGEMANQKFAFDVAENLSNSMFSRNGYSFNGWSDTANGNMIYANCAVVSNLTSTANGVVRLFAKWTTIPYAIEYRDTKASSHANPLSYTVEDAVSFTALGDVPNFAFAGWTPSAISIGSTGDRVVTANWNWIPTDGTVEASITGAKPLSIKADWAKKELNQRFGAGKSKAFCEKFGGDFSVALTKKTGKRDGAGQELSVWHDYVAGTDPTDSNSVFKATMKMVNGFPVVEWDPNLNSNGEERVYTVYGKNALGDSWHSPTNANDHFFKVDVAMPPEGTVTFNLGGATGSVDPVSVRVGQPVGDLPTPTRSGYQFLGWFTSAEGGELVTPETIVSADITIYAHWKARLVHRWSFNGNLNDSVGGQTATIVGNVTTDGTSYKTPGGSSGSAYIDLGNWILPTNGLPVTVEMWVTQDASVDYGRVFCWGGMPTEGKFSGGYQNAPEWVQLRWDGTCEAGTLGSFDVGTEYYVAMILEPTTDGAWKATYYKKSASTGETLSSVSSELKQGWTIQGFQQTDMVLGQTLTTWDPCSKNSYNELRIWNKAMTEAELTASAKAGPDAQL